MDKGKNLENHYVTLQKAPQKLEYLKEMDG